MIFHPGFRPGGDRGTHRFGGGWRIPAFGFCARCILRHLLPLLVMFPGMVFFRGGGPAPLPGPLPRGDTHHGPLYRDKPKKRAQPISTHRFSQVQPLGNASWVFTLKMPSLWEVFCQSRSWAQISPGYRHTLPPALQPVASRT